MSEVDTTFEAMGTRVRLLVEGRGAEAAAAAARRYVEDFDARLSRFRPDSELSRLNADPRARVPASRLLRATVDAALWAARRSGGLVDPTLLEPLAAAGYSSSRRNSRPAPLASALALAPPRAPAHPRPDGAWRRIRVTEDAVVRPPGLTLDSGGTGKGLAADAVASLLAGMRRVCVDCGGDLRTCGTSVSAQPYSVEAVHPLSGAPIAELTLAGDAVATSGIDRRIWATDRGYGHHLIDPATGRPAWTGLVQVTALAPTALEAETLAKAAYLSGPEGAARILGEHGGVLVDDRGRVDPVGPLRTRTLVRLEAAA